MATFCKDMHEESFNIVRFVLHLSGMHSMVFNLEDNAIQVLGRVEHETITLTGFFTRCVINR